MLWRHSEFYKHKERVVKTSNTSYGQEQNRITDRARLINYLQQAIKDNHQDQARLEHAHLVKITKHESAHESCGSFGSSQDHAVIELVTGKSRYCIDYQYPNDVAYAEHQRESPNCASKRHFDVRSLHTLFRAGGWNGVLIEN